MYISSFNLSTYRYAHIIRSRIMLYNAFVNVVSPHHTELSMQPQPLLSKWTTAYSYINRYVITTSTTRRRAAYALGK